MLEMVKNREEESVQQAYESLGATVLGGIQAVAMDMWRAYIKVTEEKLPGAKIVHDKFHVSGFLGEAVDKVRRSERRKLKAQGDETLTGTKYLWLMDPRNLSDEQEELFAQLLSVNLKAGKAWALKETFATFWNHTKEKGMTFRPIRHKGVPPASARFSPLPPGGPGDTRICSGYASPIRGFSPGRFHATSSRSLRSCGLG